MKTPKIEIIKNGPIELTGIKAYESSGGNTVDLFGDDLERVYLCRCGKSTEKPYCDGAHTKIKFTDEKSERRQPDTVDIFVGEQITIYENKGVCSHRGICYDALKAVFQMDSKAHITPDAAPIEQIIDICERCPSGALTYSLPGGSRNFMGKKSAGVVSLAPRRYRYDGAIEVTGGIPFVDREGNKPESSDHYTLCRCGASKNKPFCSGEHWRVKFIDESNDED